MKSKTQSKHNTNVLELTSIVGIIELNESEAAAYSGGITGGITFMQFPGEEVIFGESTLPKVKIPPAVANYKGFK